MARKPHKFAHNGVALETSLSEADLRSICSKAAAESTGDLWNGKHKLVETGAGEGFIVYLVKDALLGWSKFMTFAVGLEPAGARTRLETEIQWYTTSQTTAMAIPVGPKTMVAHHTYMQFVHKVANTVRAADAGAIINVTEGLAIALPLLPSTSSLGPPVAEVVVEETPAEVEAVEERTRQVTRARRAIKQWRVHPEFGDEFVVSSTAFIGREPSRGAVESGTLIAIDAAATTVSKTHARLDVRDGALFVTDLDSTNGTFLVDANDDMVQCEPRVETRVAPGWSLELGAFAVAVEPSMEGSN
jgi:FHA domain